MFLLLISFIAGVLTVFAPCILPLLPVIVGGSLGNGGVAGGFHKKKAFTIIVSLGISVIAFTILLKASTLFITIPEYVWKWISGGIVLFLGVVTLFPKLWEGRLIAQISAKANILLGKGDQKKSFWGDAIVGSALGPVFSTCSPTYFIVLATVLPVSPILGMTYLLAYTIGLCISLFVVALVGQKIMDKLGIVADPNGWFKKSMGVLFIVVGLAVMFGLDKKTQLFLLDSGFFDVTKIEQKLLEKNTASQKTEFKKAPELSSIDGYINTEGKPVTLESLRGKVVLLDIWTYSCINCQRTLPYINDWYAKYKDQGFVVVGLHTPEFGFEKVQANVEKAVKKFGIQYPVVLDNDYSTWTALGNQFWPRKYLINTDGYIIFDHAGEGAYEETEIAIQKALGVENNVSKDIVQPSDAVLVDAGKVESPEVYFGASRNEYLANGKEGTLGSQNFSHPALIFPNKLYLGGSWNITPEYAENTGSASIVFKYNAKNVYMTAGSAEGVAIEIYKDDVLVQNLTIQDEQLYPLIEDTAYGEHTLRIKIPAGSLQAFTFTFG